MKPRTNLLTQLYATFALEKDGNPEYSFLFPWAEGGGMDILFEKHPGDMNPKTKTNPPLLPKWLIEQCLGLVDGLRSLHDLRLEAWKKVKEKHAEKATQSQRRLEPQTQLADMDGGLEALSRERQDDFGIHGDLKPANILHFTQEGGSTGLGTLKIADFGLTRFYTESKRSPLAIGTNAHELAHLTYSAPELMQKDGRYSRKADIWALGCIFSQLVCWAILGPESVGVYREQRCGEVNVDPANHFPEWHFENDSFFRTEFGQNKHDNPRTFLKKVVKEASICPEDIHYKA